MLIEKVLIMIPKAAQWIFFITIMDVTASNVIIKALVDTVDD